MTSIKLLLQEIRYRKTNFALSLLAVTVAVTLFVAGPTLIDGYCLETRVRISQLESETAQELDHMEKETTRLMRDMGFNLMIVHRDTNMSDFWASDFSTVDMPQEYVDRLAEARNLTLVTHLVATLQQKIEWNNRKVLLVGHLPETTQSHLRKKTPMGFNIESGTVWLGHELGVGRKAGETVEVLGRSFRIARILPEQGSKQDITIAMRLEDAQGLLNKPGRINQILALGCRCAGERLPKVRKQLSEALPETKITEFRSIALARAEQRDLVAAERKKLLKNMAASRLDVQRKLETMAGVTTPLVVLACAVWVGSLALSNVRERRTEIGLFRALGIGSLKVASFFLGKAVLLGLSGGLIGFVVGTRLAQGLGGQALAISPDHFTPAYDMLLWTILGAPLLTALASYLPTLMAVIQDPALALREH